MRTANTVTGSSCITHRISPINLAGFTLTDDPEAPAQYVLPYWVLDPGTYVLLYADDQPSTDTELHVPFKLRDKGEILILFDSERVEVQRVSFPGMESNVSYALHAETLEWVPTDRCTPGYDNTDEGYAAYQESHRAVSPVFINEVMPGNTITLSDEDGEYSDWGGIIQSLSRHHRPDGMGVVRYGRYPQAVGVSRRPDRPGRIPRRILIR